MAVRFTRVFGLYTFFSVFLPGMMFLLGVAPLAAVVYGSVTGASLATKIASNQLVTLVGALVFVTLAMFVGFGLHSLGAWFEQKVGDVHLLLLLAGVEDVSGHDLEWLTIRVGNRHRKLFHEMLNSRYDATHATLVSSFIEVANEQFPRVGLDLDTEAPKRDTDGSAPDSESDGEDDISEPESKALYTLVRGQIHRDQSGRSRTFQAVFASCRSMFVAWAFLTFAYTFFVTGLFLVTNGVDAAALPIPTFLKKIVDALWVVDTEAESKKLKAAFFLVVTIGFVGMYGFASVARSSKQYYLQYLVSDFLLLHRETDAEDSGQQASQTPDRSPRIESNR